MPRFWPIPTIPTHVAMTWCRFATQVPCAFMLAFDVIGAQAGIFDHVLWHNDFLSWCNLWSVNIICTGDGFREFWHFFNNGVTTFSFLGGPTFPHQAPGTYDSPMLCPVFRKESVGFSPVRVGHLYGPRLPQVYWQNNSWTPAALSAYGNFIHWMEIGFASQGWHCLPTIYSPKDFATYRIGSFSLLRKPATRYSRRDRGGFNRPYPTFPIVT